MKKIENLKNELEDTLEKLEIKSETFLDEAKEFVFEAKKLVSEIKEKANIITNIPEEVKKEINLFYMSTCKEDKAMAIVKARRSYLKLEQKLKCSGLTSYEIETIKLHLRKNFPCDYIRQNNEADKMIKTILDFKKGDK